MEEVKSFHSKSIETQLFYAYFLIILCIIMYSD